MASINLASTNRRFCVSSPHFIVNHFNSCRWRVKAVACILQFRNWETSSPYKKKKLVNSYTDHIRKYEWGTYISSLDYILWFKKLIGRHNLLSQLKKVSSYAQFFVKCCINQDGKLQKNLLDFYKMCLLLVSQFSHAYL